MKNRFLISKMLKIVNSLALLLAVLSVQSTCVWVHHQPIVPEILKEKGKV